MATVTNTIVLPDGSAPSHAAVEIELVASTTSRAAGWISATDETILSLVRPTVTAGEWTADLTPNANIDPAGTVYKVTEYADRHRYVHHISVSSAGGTVHDLLVDPPESLGSAASELYTDAAVAALAAGLPYLVGASNGTNDTTALTAAVASGRNVLLSAGQTYINHTELTLETDGQIIDGNGSTIKRPNQVSASFATAVTSGVTTSVVVSSATGLFAGQKVTVASADGNTFHTGGSLEIASVNGTTVTFATSPDVSLPSGGTIWAGWFQLNITADDVVVRDLVFDGNKANWTFYRWQNTAEIEVSGRHSRILGCRIHDAPGEGIVSISDHSTIDSCLIEDVNGNGVHYGLSTHAVLSNTSIVNANLAPIVGHADGCVSLSNDVHDLTISNCYLEGSSLAAIGGWDSTDNSDLTVIGCTIRDCGKVLEGTFPVDTEASGLVFTGNRCYDSGKLDVNQTSSSSTEFPSKVVISNNYFERCRIYCARAVDVSITNNEIQWLENTTQYLVELASSAKRTVVVGNTLVGGAAGVAVTGDADSEPLIISANAIRNPYLRGIDIGSVTNARNVSVTNNVITTDSASMSASAFVGIVVSIKAAIQGNTVFLDRAGTGDFCISVGGTGECLIQGNVLKGGQASIREFGGTSGAVIQNNVYNTAPLISGSHTTANNVLVSF